MDLSTLYNIAFDMLTEKKSNGFGFSVNDNSTVTVISTEDDEIFKATNGNKIENGNLTNTCSETEAISLMIKANKSKIDTIITLNVENGAFVMPCENCIDLILQINSKNIDCNIMTNINESIKLGTFIDSKDLLNKENENVISNDSFEDWSDGWDTSNNTDNTLTNLKDFNMLDDDINNPMPKNSTPISKTTPSRYYQSMYSNNSPTPVDSSISVSPITSQNSKPFKSKSISDIMKKNGLSESDKKDFNKQRLFNAFTTDTITNPDSNNEITDKQALSKKELLRMAKEKKKMAKKDAKILENTNKKNK
ncbi:MAG: cytidine deaminase [Oscillospiraceae bacterium]